MEKTYAVSVDGNYNFEFTEAEIKALDILELSGTKKHILSRGRSVTAEILTSDFYKKAYSVEINSSVFTVSVSGELERMIREMGLSAKISKEVKDIKAPMPGLILEVNVAPGQEVKEGDYLLVLEAMKMENTLTAPRDGVVKAVAVEKGQTVDKNQLLVEME